MSSQSYTISELAKDFGITTRTMRFYEEKGLISPRREGQKRLYSSADRVRIKLILRGKRIGMSLNECVEVIDMYDPEHNNADQLHSLISNVQKRRQLLEQQKHMMFSANVVGSVGLTLLAIYLGKVITLNL